MMNKHLNVIIANTPINNGNRGCVALTVSCVYLIDKVLSEKGIDYTLCALDTNLPNYERYSLNLFDRQIELLPISYPSPLSLKGWGTIFQKPKAFWNSIIRFRNADYIFDIGQGDSFADIYGKGRFRKIDRIHVLARLFNKPYCLLPQTIGPFSDESIRKKAIKSIKKAQLVMARDKQSYDYVLQNVVTQKNIAEYIDVAFFLPYKKQSFNKELVHVGLNISALLWHGGYAKNNQFGLKEDYPTLVRSIINYFLTDENVVLHLVPHVVLQERDIENDYAVCYEILKEINHPRLILAPFFLGPCEAKGYIAGLNFFMGARMHATIAAFSSAVPVVPMAYSRKFNGLFIDTLDYKCMIDLKKESNEDILMKTRTAFEQRNQLKEIIQLRLDGVVEDKKKRLCHDLTKFLQL